MLAVKTAAPADLVALRFKDDGAFREAARRAATEKIPVEPVGNRTLIVMRSAEPRFTGLAFTVQRVADPEKVGAAERSALRRHLAG